MDLTRPRAAKAVSAVPESKGMRVCERCQHSVTPEAKVCPDCGAPLVPGALSDIPTEVHRDLAKANLLRLRHDLKGAEAICISILKRFPNSQPTHTLLGDIAEERADLEEAERWYDLALELDPSSAADRRKLEDIRLRRNATESASTVEQIGLPTTRPFPWFNAVLGTLALVSIIAAAIVGLSRPSVPRSQVVVQKPIEAPPEAVPVTPKSTNPAIEAKPTGQTPTNPVENPTTPPAETTTPPNAQADELMRLVAQRSPFGANLVSVQTDPRTKLATLIFNTSESDDQRTMAAELGRAVLELDMEAQSVTLRAMRDNRLVYVADMPRTRYAETLLDSWKTENASIPNAFSQYVLTNEWTAPVGGNSGSAGQP